MKISRFAAALLTLVMLVCALPAFAETEIMYVIKTSIQVYYSPSTSAKKYCTLSYGDEVMVAARNSTWAQLTNEAGAIGYCKTADLSTKDPSVPPVYVYTKSSDVKVYKKTSTSSTTLARLDKGTRINGVAKTPDGTWVRVEYDGGYGFIKTSNLTLTAPSDQKTLTVYVTANAAALRKTASASAKQVGAAYYGEEFTLSKLSGSWGYVSNGTVSGWVKKSSLATKNPLSASAVYYAAQDSVTLYARVGDSLGGVAVINKSDEVTLVGITPNKKYYVVDYQGAYCYVEVAKLTAANPADDIKPGDGDEDESITVYVIATNASAYKSASSSASIVGTVSYGEELTCTQVKDSWALVSNASGAAWVKKSALSTKDPNFAAVTYYVNDTGATLYARPKTSASALAKLSARASVSVVGKTADGDWYRIEYNGSYGYVKTSALTSTKPAEAVTMYVRYNIVSDYKTSSSSSAKVGEVCYGDELSCLQVSGEWALVSNSYGQGWVKQDALTTKDPNVKDTALYAAADTTYVLQKPSSSAKKLTTLEKGETVTAVAITTDNSWVRVRYGDGYAFIAAAQLSTSSPAGYKDPYIGTAGATLEKVIAIAVAQYGKPYVYAEEGPDSYDCTGLMWYAFSKGAGVYLKRTGYEQGYDSRYPRITSVSGLKRGDIVVFDTIEDGENDLSDHTGLYLGGGLFIHSSSGAGKVIVSDLSSGYYNRKFSWGLRIIE